MKSEKKPTDAVSNDILSATNEILARLKLTPPAEDRSGAKKYLDAYEEWKNRALAEFPALGRAGTPFNREFVARAKKMKLELARELELPNWPYVLALQVNGDLSGTRTAVAQTTPQNALPPVQQSQQQPSSKPNAAPQPATLDGGNYTVEGLKAANPFPTRGTVRGTITSADKLIGGDAMDVVLVLDGQLTTEINLTTKANGTPFGSYPWLYAYPYYRSGGVKTSSNIELIKENNSIRLQQKDTRRWDGPTPVYTSYSRGSFSAVEKKDVLVLKVGETVSVEGFFIRRPNGKVILKGALVLK